MTKKIKNVSVIILAAGDSRRMKLENKKSKIFMNICEKPCLFYSLNEFRKCVYTKEIIIVCKEEHKQLAEEIINKNDDITYKVVKGGKTRQESVFNGFKSTSNTDYLVIHDAARCLITKDLINKVIISAIQNDSCAVLGVPVKDTIKVIETVEDKNTVKYTADREFLWQIQTPQVLKKNLYAFCINEAIKENKVFTDDSQLIENYSKSKISVIMGDYNNFKLTTKEDVFLAESILKIKANAESLKKNE